MNPDSLLTGENAAFIDQQYARWLEDPTSVSEGWRDLFEPWDRPDHAPNGAPHWPRRSIFDPLPATGATAVAAGGIDAKVVQMINTYRVRGHMQADIDPLERRQKVVHPELTLEYYGLSDRDLDTMVDTAPLFGMPSRATLREVLEHCQRTYARSIGAEFMNINSLEEKLWVQEALETLPGRELLSLEEEKRILRKLADAESFERMLHTRFPGTKRFSLEGAETLIPMMDLLIEHTSEHGVGEAIIGMAHRGRLNVLANILEKPVGLIVDEFEDTRFETYQGSGDVKYHLGYSADIVTVQGDPVHLSLAFNPSHLEAVDPVVEGRVRAKQDRDNDLVHERTLAVLVHGDAAFSGQGVVAEVLDLSQLHGYRTGGTIHVIVNNQIGFTTPPTEGRSTPYATDVARMLGVPIFHVNGEDPRAVTAVVHIATDWRAKFHEDVIIDMYCYRKHGHNEGDEPSFTQPLLYEQIRSRPTPREVFAHHLVEQGQISKDEADAIADEARARLERLADGRPEERPHGRKEDRKLPGKQIDDGLDLFLKNGDAAGAHGEKHTEGLEDTTKSPLKGMWERFLNSDPRSEADTSYDLGKLKTMLERANTLPDGFHAHAKVKRLLKQRLQMAHGERPLDWAVGEQAAFATLVSDGWRVRLSGQDSGRGTFSQRHAVLTDIDTGAEYYPLQHLKSPQGAFDVIDSSLSEAGVLGFEYGYSLECPDGLVIWEAQFGDFANGAQVVMDQFISSGEQKWRRLSGVVLLLPHGYEGQGPEHSSARPERYLQLCAQDNMQVANCTTPGNFFHLLRRQVLRSVRKPLIVFTPKSLLRHPAAVSSLEDLAGAQFQHVIDDAEVEPSEVKRVVLCSGKVYYDLLAARRDHGEGRVALVRVELLYPYPQEAIDAVLARYPKDIEIAWCQEEPRNQGA